MGFAQRLRRHRLLLIVAALLLVGLVVAIDDPLRDFTMNYAEIAEGADDETLRPLIVDRPADATIVVVEQAARRIRNWAFVGHAASGDTTLILFVRTSRVWRFKDDVTLRVREIDEGRSIVTGESRSRVGFGDLGQNPRNLRRILAELRTVLGE